MTFLCASDAFYTQLKRLLITDFPCGLGTWRPKPSGKDFDPKFDSGSPQCENITDLLELENSGPYAVDCTWSKEAKSLRKVAVETPEYLNDPNFVLKHFSTLRIINKNVSNIDKGILKFVNLKELFLGANFIQDLDGRNLPNGLEVLELAANKIKSLSGLKGDNLCSLLHLGLAHNEISSIPSRALTPSRWPSLLSLDLSYNNISELQATVEILKDLPVLRNLLLIGNPLYLSKCYHGYIIDSIPGLSFLDDTEVSADDRHQFKSFSRLKDMNTDTCQIAVDIIGLSGVKKPIELEDSESAPDYPKIEFKYHVEFMFLNDVTSEEQPAEKDPEVVQEDNSVVVDSTSHEVDVQTIMTEKLPWLDALEFNFSKTLNISELARLRSFLQAGVTFNVVAVKHSYVLEDPQLTVETGNAGDSQRASTAGKPTDKSNPKNSKDVKEKTKSAKEKGDKGAKEKGKKDKRVPTDLFELPQERTSVGTYHVTLGCLLEGECGVRVCSPCKEEGSEAKESNESQENENASNGPKQPSAKKKNKDGDKPAKAAASKVKPKEVVKSEAAGTKGTKGGKGKEKVEEVPEDSDDTQAPPPPLSINFEIKLNRWKNTKDVLQETKN